MFFSVLVSLQTRDRIGTGGSVVDCRGLLENEGYVSPWQCPLTSLLPWALALPESSFHTFVLNARHTGKDFGIKAGSGFPVYKGSCKD